MRRTIFDDITNKSQISSTNLYVKNNNNTKNFNNNNTKCKNDTNGKNNKFIDYSTQDNSRKCIENNWSISSPQLPMLKNDRSVTVFKNDPSMVEEYSFDIFRYLYKLEKQNVIDVNFLQINETERDLLLNWLIKIHSTLQLLEETFFLTIYLMDKYQYSVKNANQIDHSFTIGIQNLQLFGITCLFIASKWEEINYPNVSMFSLVTNGEINVGKILSTEWEILKILQFTIDFVNPLNFLRRISRADNYDIYVRTIAKYLISITMLDYNCVGTLTSVKVAAAYLLARKILGKKKWNKKMILLSGGYTMEQIIPTYKNIINYLLSKPIHKNLIKKYQSKNFFKASIVCRQWILLQIDPKKNQA